jgi:alkylated DNA repair dioxygenase AlkB
VVTLAGAKAAVVDAIFEVMPRSVAQIPLFGSSPGVLADDERGRIVYTPGLVLPAIAQVWFAELRKTVPWKAERRRMYDRDVDVPRLTAHFHLGPEDQEAGVPAAIRQAAEEVLAETEVPFNSVGLNLYRDGRDSVAPHNDHLSVLVEGHPIALLSLGGPRRMTIRAKEPPRRVIHVDLEGGSLLMMSYATQLHYTHGVPKTAAPVAERISLAFRVKPPRDASSAAVGIDPYR